MSDNEIEDISFLPESPRSSKRSLYEYEAERCRQFLCSQKRAVCVICSIIVALFVVALVVAIARPPCIPCERDFKVQNPPNASAENVVPTATNGEPFPWSDVRLPDAVIPETYSIFMHPNLTTFTFSGHVNISLYVKKSTDFIIFHERGLNLTSISLKSLSTDGSFSITVVKQLEYVPNQQFLIRLGQELTAGSRCVLSIFFTGALSPNLAGFYKSSYQLANGDRRWLGVTQFEATDARGAFPCFDEPAMKANFSLSIVRPKDYITLFNTPKKLSRPLGRDSALVVDEYPYSVRMSSYLVAFVICDFSSNSTTSSTGIKVSVYAQPQLIQQGQFALEVGAKVIDYYSDYFGIAYPLDKQDMIAVPDMSPGAMENWGLITYRQTILLYEPREASASDQQLSAVVVAHELAHQWFGNLVTMKWWNDLWLNEGFASYVEFLGANVSKPEWRMLDQLISDTLVPALHKDSLWNSHPISVDVRDPSEINDIFDTISYDKGCCILRMLEHYMGASGFKNGLRSYLKKHAYANADSDDLWAALTEQSNGIEVKSFMDTWIKQMGYPVVIVEQTGNTVTLRQERFLTNPRANITVHFTSPYGYKWKIPVDYTTDAQSQNTAHDIVWLDPQVNSEVKFSLTSSVKWLKLNVGQHGFYRVHYTPALWRALADQLNADHTVLSAADRAGLVDDVFYLARSGHVNITLAMDVSKYLAHEADYVPWSVALTNLMYIEHLLQNHPSYDRYKSYLLSLMADRIKALGWRDEGSLLDVYLRDYLMAIAVQLGDKFVLNQAMDSFRAWRNGTRVWANLKTVVYQAGVQYGTEDDWQYVYERYKREIIPSEKRKLLHSLSASNDISRLNRLLQLSLQEDEVRLGDSVSVVTGVASRTTASAALAWHFVKLHWPEFHSRYGEGQFEMTSLITHTTSLFKTPFEYEEVRDFYVAHLNGRHQRSVAQALETIEVNIDWLARNGDDIVRWLDANVKI